MDRKKPNIIFLMADDMGYGDIGSFNDNSKIPTPNIDQLAEEGIRFTDAHSSSAVCTPSRYSVLTGRYCWRTRLKQWVIFDYEPPLIEEERLTVADLLKEKGYATACVGKWHLGMEWPRDENGEIDFTERIADGPTERGFDYYFGIRASLDMPPYAFIENDRTVGIPNVEKDPYNPQQRQGPMTPDWQDEQVGPRFTEKAVEFVKDSVHEEPDRPFFLYFPTSAPHRPCTPPSFIEGRSEAGPRGDMVAEVDWTVGKLMDTLDELGIAEETLFIVTSDNGARAECYNGRDYGHSSNGDWRGQKADIWDGGHREPFVARWPGNIAAGESCDETICLSDLLATCASLVDYDLPEEAGEDSFDISPALLGKDHERPIRGATVHHSGAGHFAVRRGAWKAIFRLGSGGFTEPEKRKPVPGDPEGQLYNLENDPEEENNLWLERQDVVFRLRELLNKYKEEGTSRPAAEE